MSENNNSPHSPTIAHNRPQYDDHNLIEAKQVSKDDNSFHEGVNMDSPHLAQSFLPNRVDKIDVEFYRTTYTSATEAQELLIKLRQQLAEAEKAFMSKNGALASFGSYIQQKYEITESDSFDSETGFITRTSV